MVIIVFMICVTPFDANIHTYIHTYTLKQRDRSTKKDANISQYVAQPQVQNKYVQNRTSCTVTFTQI